MSPKLPAPEDVMDDPAIDIRTRIIAAAMHYIPPTQTDLGGLFELANWLLVNVEKKP